MTPAELLILKEELLAGNVGNAIDLIDACIAMFEEEAENGV